VCAKTMDLSSPLVVAWHVHGRAEELSSRAIPSCSSLPARPTPAELEKAGFIVSVPVEEMVVGVLLAVGGIATFLPQCVKFLRTGTVRGASMPMVFLSMLTTCLQFAGVVADASPKLSACRALPPAKCFGNTLAFQQLLMQALGAMCVFLCYVIVARREGSESRTRSLRSGPPLLAAAVSCGVAVAAPLAFAAAALAAGPCLPSLGVARDVVAGTATLLQACVMLPQILLLCLTKDHGSLSVVMVTAQGLGSAIYVADLAVEHAHVETMLPFAVMSMECMLVLGMIAYFHARGRGSWATAGEVTVC